MDKHSVYIVTDSNRTYLEVGFCKDLNSKMNEIRVSTPSIFPNSPKLNNLIHLEEYDSLEKALLRTAQLRQFTRMQREKLVRMRNPNWLNLLHNFTQAQPKANNRYLQH